MLTLKLELRKTLNNNNNIEHVVAVNQFAEIGFVRLPDKQA